MLRTAPTIARRLRVLAVSRGTRRQRRICAPRDDARGVRKDVAPRAQHVMALDFATTRYSIARHAYAHAVASVYMRACA